jgi:S1-C subfamily serine protease
MKHILIAPILLAFASHLALAQDGSSTRAYLGVGLQPGALVGNVSDSGPAQGAGIQPGDLIVGFDGKEIKSSDELLRAVAATPVGQEVVIDVIRGWQQGMTTAKLGQAGIKRRGVGRVSAEAGRNAAGARIAWCFERHLE